MIIIYLRNELTQIDPLKVHLIFFLRIFEFPKQLVMYYNSDHEVDDRLTFQYDSIISKS